MMSPGTAYASLKVNPVSKASKVSSRPRLRQLVDRPDLLEHISSRLGPHALTVDFSRAGFHAIPGNTFREFEELIIFAGSNGLVISSSMDGNRTFLTGIKGRHNECLILFRHAYGKVTCRLGVGNLGADAHVGFLTHTTFKEAWRAEYGKQPDARVPDDPAFWTDLPFAATQLNELQGIVWRGGTLCIERITLEP